MRYNTILLLLCLLFGNVLLTTSCSTQKSPDTEEQDDENEGGEEKKKKKKKDTKKESEGTDESSLVDFKPVFSQLAIVLQNRDNQNTILRGKKRISFQSVLNDKIKNATRAAADEPDELEAINALKALLPAIMKPKSRATAGRNNAGAIGAIQNIIDAFGTLKGHDLAKQAFGELENCFTLISNNSLDSKTDEEAKEMISQARKGTKNAFYEAFQALEAAGLKFKEAAKK